MEILLIAYGINPTHQYQPSSPVHYCIRLSTDPQVNSFDYTSNRHGITVYKMYYITHLPSYSSFVVSAKLPATEPPASYDLVVGITAGGFSGCLIALIIAALIIRNR